MLVLSSREALRPLQTRSGLWAWCWDYRITISVHFSSPPYILLAPLMPYHKLLVLTVKYDVQLSMPWGHRGRARAQICKLGSRWYRWGTLHPCRFTSGREPRYLQLGGSHGLSVRQWKRLLVPTWFELRTAQPVASSNTDFSILDPDWGFSVLFPQL